VQLLYDSGTNDEEAWSEDLMLYRAVSPLERAGIFVGMDTGEHAGAGFHTSAPFYPTMERTRLDMTHPQIQQWNTELLAVAGLAARITYDAAMFHFQKQEAETLYGREAVAAREQTQACELSVPSAPWHTMKALRQLQDSQDEMEDSMSPPEAHALAISVMRAHTFAAQENGVGDCIGQAFWSSAVSLVDRGEMLVAGTTGTVRTVASSVVHSPCPSSPSQCWRPAPS
jgi:hypothetical protein